MSITTTTTTSVPSSTANEQRLSSTTTSINPSQHFINERYPKTCLEDIPSIVLEYPPRMIGAQTTRSRHSLRFRTQPVTLTEINETDEENKNDNDQQQETLSNNGNDFQRLEHLALSQNIRRSARKKAPFKNYLERQRLKAMREEPSETDGN